MTGAPIPSPEGAASSTKRLAIHTGLEPALVAGTAQGNFVGNGAVFWYYSISDKEYVTGGKVEVRLIRAPRLTEPRQ